MGLVHFIWRALCLGLVLSSSRAYAEDACGGPGALLAVLDRPTVGDSTCVVPAGKLVLEAGINVGSAAGASGRLRTFPNAELRWGLGAHTEAVYLPPNETQLPGVSGTTASVIGIKHLLGQHGSWQWSGEALVTTASGSSALGSAHPGVAVNGIASDSIGPVGVSFMLGASSESMPQAAGGQRYTSLNPDFVLTWGPGGRMQWYGELYGATHTAYGTGYGVNADGGVQFLVTPALEVDLERGVQWRGTLGGLGHYTGVGLGLLF